jgi:hypothetical protein
VNSPNLCKLLFLLFIVIGCNVLLTKAQSTTPPKATSPIANSSPSPLITGSIKGRLVADDGQPLTNANVMVQSLSAAPSVKPAHVDAEGRFTFEDLPPAAYLVVASAPGYIDRSMSEGSPSEWPRHLIGSNVRITMIRGGVITGTITNAKGEPITGVPVHALATSDNASSLSGFFNGGGISESDDRGVYRMYGLLPGQYVVQAGGKGAFGQPAASGFDMDVPTYYPSSTRDTAVPVSVRGGDDTTGIDIKYRGTEGHTISGSVLGDISTSAAVGAVTVFLSHANTTSALSLEIVPVSADPRRGFSFNGVADGDYDVFAGYFTGLSENGLMAIRRVTVRGGDVTGVDLRLTPLASIAGSITLDPIKPEDKCDKRGSQLTELILNIPRDETKKVEARTMVSMIGGGLGSLNDKGEFVMRNLDPGRYRLELKLPSEGWYVNAIKVPATAQVQQQPTTGPSVANPTLAGWPGAVSIKSGEKLAGVSVSIGQDAAGLRGRFDTQGAIQEGTRVHLVPVAREQANNVLRYSETIVKSDGTFALANIAPGRYFILARVEPPTEPDAKSRPVAWDAAARAKLRVAAEKTNTIVELKSCERAIDYTLKP